MRWSCASLQISPLLKEEMGYAEKPFPPNSILKTFLFTSTNLHYIKAFHMFTLPPTWQRHGYL